jgi:GTP-binding protein
VTRFIDTVRIYVKAGDGGNGCVAFRREKYVPRGGPSGGDGGRGGDVILRADSGLNTLYDFKYRPHLKAKNGRPGMGDKMTGRSGDDLVVDVPLGTTVKDSETGEILADLVNHGDQVVVAKGGRGGRGNCHFATPTNRAPRHYEEGAPGQERTIDLELRSIADVGLVGLPNAGKSTLLRAISNATPEVGPYPFTTLTPHLGVVDVPNSHGQKFVVADIPGLIEGASQGKGLGHQFLRHIERTSVLLYVVDATGFDGDPLKDFEGVRREVMSYSEGMRRKKSVVALNKIDLLSSPDEITYLTNTLQEMSQAPVFAISSQHGEGVHDLIICLFQVVSENIPGLDAQ